MYRDPYAQEIALQALRATSSLVPVEKFGDVTANYAGALEAAVAETALNGGMVTHTAGKTYTLARKASITDTNVRIDFNGAKIVRQRLLAGQTNDYGLEISQSFSSVYAVTSIGVDSNFSIDGGTGNTTTVLQMPASAVSALVALGMAKGSRLKVFSDDLIAWDQDIHSEHYAEIAQVAAWDTGTDKIWFFTPLRLASLMLTTIRLVLMGDYECTLLDPWFEDDPDNYYTTNQALLHIRGASEPRVYRPKMMHGMAIGLEFMSCWRPFSTNMYAFDLRTVDADNIYGYGIRELACIDGRHYAPEGSRIRHLYTTGAFSTTAADTRVERYGGVIGTKVFDGVATEAMHAGFDTHADALYVDFINCSSDANYEGDTANLYGFQLRGQNCRLVDCSSDSIRGFNLSYNGTGTGLDVINFRHRRLASAPAANLHSNIDGSGSLTRPKSKISGSFVSEGQSATFFSVANCDIDFSGAVDSKFSGSSTAFLFVVTTGSNLNISDLDLDISRGSGTGFKVARMVDSTVTNTSVRIDGLRARVPSGFSTLHLTDLNGATMSATAKNVDVTGQGTSSNGLTTSGVGFSNTGAATAFQHDATSNGGEGVQSNVITATFASSGGTQSVTFAGRGHNEVFYIPTITGTAKDFTIDQTPVKRGQSFTLVNSASSTKTARILSSTALPLLVPIVLSPGQSITFKGNFSGSIFTTPIPKEVVLAQSAVQVSHTGDTNETTFATVTIPANSMGPNGRLEITTLWSYTNSGNNKTLKVKLGASSFVNITATTTATDQTFTQISNRNSASSQVGFASTSGNGVGGSTGSLVTASIDTTADASLTITGTLASSGETVALEGYIIKLFPGA